MSVKVTGQRFEQEMWASFDPEEFCGLDIELIREQVVTTCTHMGFFPDDANSAAQEIYEAANPPEETESE